MRHGQIDKRTAKVLPVLQDRIKKAKLPPSQVDETLTIATWNPRELGKRKRLEPRSNNTTTSPRYRALRTSPVLDGARGARSCAPLRGFVRDGSTRHRACRRRVASSMPAVPASVHALPDTVLRCERWWLRVLRRAAAPRHQAIEHDARPPEGWRAFLGTLCSARECNCRDRGWHYASDATPPLKRSTSRLPGSSRRLGQSKADVRNPTLFLGQPPPRATERSRRRPRPPRRCRVRSGNR